MKTTLDLPAPLLRNAKALSAQRGESLKDFVIAALQQRIGGLQRRPEVPQAPPWMAFVGQLAPIRKEIMTIQKDIDATFGEIDAGAWK